MFKTLTVDMMSGKGVEIKKGEKVKVAFDVPKDKTNPGAGFVHTSFSVTTTDGRRIVSRQPHKIGVKVPGIKTLQKYSDCIAKSFFGASVEPDGVDSQGAPSWLLFLGMI